MSESGMIIKADTPRDLGDIEICSLTKHRACLEMAPGELHVLGSEIGRLCKQAPKRARGPTDILRDIF
jgi:hypothetical protein